MTLHREGRTLLLTSLLIVLGINGLVAYFFPENVYVREAIVVITSLFYLIILQFFRVPKRQTVLDREGLIELRPNPQDGRSKLVFLTEAGRRFRDDVREVKEGQECGIGLGPTITIQDGDILEIVGEQSTRRTL